MDYIPTQHDEAIRSARMPFVPAENTTAYLKAALMGAQGSGKTYTAGLIASGLHKLLVSKGLMSQKEPVFMCDTETGANWLIPMFRANGIELMVDRSRAFADLVEDVRTASAKKGIIIIDSVTHYWNELKQAYLDQRGRSELTFRDWDPLKRIWQQFTDLLVNGTCHIIMCGRLAWEYEWEEIDQKRELVKRAVKLRAEGETGYEPSLLLLMERHQELGQGGNVEKVWRTCQVLKDRSTKLDGRCFHNPTFEDFLPHIECLNLGGPHLAVDTSRSSTNSLSNFDELVNAKDDMDARLRQAEYESIEALLLKHFPGANQKDKLMRNAYIERAVGRPVGKRYVQSLPLSELQRIYKLLYDELEKPRDSSEQQANDEQESDRAGQGSNATRSVAM